jgi:hypothetical protein
MHIVGSYMTTAHVQVQHDQDEHASLVPISLWFSFLSVYLHEHAMLPPLAMPGAAARR